MFWSKLNAQHNSVGKNAVIHRFDFILLSNTDDIAAVAAGLYNILSISNWH